MVDTTVDGTGSPFGDLSLRQAVNLVNALDAAESITFSPTVFDTPQTITLTSGQLELSAGTQTITGPAVGVTISGRGASRVFQIDKGVTATISGVTITGGRTTYYGSGIRNYGKLTLTDATVSGNESSSRFGLGGGIWNYGTMMLTDTTVSGNYTGDGSAIYNQKKGTITLTDVTVSGNSAYGGGAIDNNGTMTVANATVSGNSARAGGGIANSRYGSMSLVDVTVSGNSAGEGGGIYNQNGGTFQLANTIVAANTAGSDPDVFGAVDSLGHNLIGNTSGSTGWSGTNDITNQIADLGPLGSYGGPTQTIPLLAGSPAIGRGVSVSGLTIDQRGFPLDFPSRDIGAFQVNPLVINTTVDGTSSPLGDLSLRQGINLAQALRISIDHIQPDRLRHPPDDHADCRPARAELGLADDRRPDCGLDDQRRGSQPGLPD